MHSFLLNDILVIVLLSVVVLYLCQRMRLPIIVGFLLTGVIAGPHGFALVREIEAVKTLAEAGIVLLLFTIGMEFSFRSLLQIRKTVLLGGSLQIALTILAGFAAARLFGYSVNEALFAGFLLSLSSTAIVMKTLQDRAEMETPQGNADLGILIFQDMAAVPMMLLVTLLAVNRNSQIISNPAANLKFAGGDILFVVGDAKNIQQVKLTFNQRVDRNAGHAPAPPEFIRT